PAQPPAGVVAGRVVLPYWTKQYRNLSLDVDRAVKSLGLHRLTPADAAVSDAEALTLALPLYVPDSTDATFRLTGTASGRVVDRPAVLTPADGAHSLLDTGVPRRELQGATWRTQLCLPGGRVLGLPLLLIAGRGGVEVARPGRPGPLGRLIRVARRLLGAVPGTTTRRKA
ncbi:glycosyltransferase family 2 protein, partial [Streptomyces sp. NPDC004561]